MITETHLSEQIAEPADGGRYVLEDSNGDLSIIYRADQACQGVGQADERWFHGHQDDPMSWENITRGAVRLWALVPYTGTVHARDVPAAVFSGED